VVEALRKFGAPLEHTDQSETFGEAGGVSDWDCSGAIDILTEITGVEFGDAWKKKGREHFLRVPVHFISLDDLIANKQALGRSSDLMGPQAEFKKQKLRNVSPEIVAFLPRTRNAPAAQSMPPPSGSRRRGS